MALYVYKEDEIEISETEGTVTYEYLTPDMGRYFITQFYPCAEGDQKCLAKLEPHESKSFDFTDCDSERKDEFFQYWLTRLG